MVQRRPRSRDCAGAMAELCSLEDTVSEEEKDFQKVLVQIGGREKIHLVSDIGKSKEDDDAGILQDFLRDVFSQTSFPNGLLLSALQATHCDIGNENPECRKTAPSQAFEMPLTVRPKAVSDEVVKEAHNDSSPKTVTRRTNISSTKRTIDCPIIVFLFRQTYISCQANLVCLKEILRDVKARIKRAKIAQPALIGLIRTTLESAETEQCAQTLENMMRDVFHRHVTDTIWIGSFIPKREDKILEIKKNICRVIYSSRTADNTGHRRNSFLWPFQCLFGPNRRAPRDEANSSSTGGHSQTGHHEDSEEGIPLKSSNKSASAHLEEESAVKDS